MLVQLKKVKYLNAFHVRLKKMAQKNTTFSLTLPFGPG